jgi:hypothetical protein
MTSVGYLRKYGWVAVSGLALLAAVLAVERSRGLDLRGVVFASSANRAAIERGDLPRSLQW